MFFAPYCGQDGDARRRCRHCTSIVVPTRLALVNESHHRGNRNGTQNEICIVLCHPGGVMSLCTVALLYCTVPPIYVSNPFVDDPALLVAAPAPSNNGVATNVRSKVQTRRYD